MANVQHPEIAGAPGVVFHELVRLFPGADSTVLADVLFSLVDQLRVGGNLTDGDLGSLATAYPDLADKVATGIGR